MSAFTLSASSLKLWDGCPRRWVYRYVYRLPEPPSEANLLGTRVHAEMEAWIRDGVLPQHPLALRILSLYDGHPYFPSKDTTEAESEFLLTIDGVKWKGYRDFRRAKDVPTHRIVGDFKTTSDLKYAVRPWKGVLVDSDDKVDVQSTLYAAVEFVLGAERVDGHWPYVCTKSEGKRLVELEFDRSHVEDLYGGMHERAKKALKVHQARPAANDVPYSTGYCFAYKKPCPYADRCQKPVGMFSSKPLDLGAPEGADAMVDFLSKIRDSFPTTTIDTVIDEDDAPPPPPDEDDAPPPPDEDEELAALFHAEAGGVPGAAEALEAALDALEDEPPPPPDEDEVHPAEALAAEAAVSPEVSRCVTDAVESGFINPPEAAGKPAYKDPEEAAAGEGVAPPKAKKPSKAKGKTAKKAETVVVPEADRAAIVAHFNAVVGHETMEMVIDPPLAAEDTRPTFVEAVMQRALDVSTPGQGLASNTPFAPDAGHRTMQDDVRAIVREELRAMFADIAAALAGGGK